MEIDHPVMRAGAIAYRQIRPLPPSRVHNPDT
jgi:hypothetical protein